MSDEIKKLLHAVNTDEYADATNILGDILGDKMRNMFLDRVENPDATLESEEAVTEHKKAKKKKKKKKGKKKKDCPSSKHKKNDGKGIGESRYTAGEMDYQIRETEREIRKLKSAARRAWDSGNKQLYGSLMSDVEELEERLP